jgi:hypothetical protein
MTAYAAQLNNNMVEDVIVGNFEWAIENLGGEWVDCTCGDKPCAGIGFTYNPITQTFTPPPVSVYPEIPEP